MSINFALRPDGTLNAFRCGANKLGSTWSSVDGNVATCPADASAIGGYSYDMDKGSVVYSQLLWSARKNIPSTGRAVSVLCRVKVGQNSGNLGIFALSGHHGVTLNTIAVAYLGGQIRVVLGNKNGGTVYNANIAAWTPTVDVWYDLVLSYDGTGGANSLKVYVDGVLVGQATPAAWSNPNEWANIHEIILGAATFDVATTRIKINEFVIWDEIINPTATGLNLNGASRAAFVTTTALEGDLSVGAGAGNIRSGVSETINGLSVVGTCAVPTAANVRSGVSVDNTVGTCTVPSPSNVRYGTAVDNTTGTCRVPSAADVRKDTAVDNTVGSCYVPTAANVRYGVAVDNTTGTLAPATNVTTQLTLAAFGTAVRNKILTIVKGDTLTISLKLKSGSDFATLTGGAVELLLAKDDDTIVTVPSSVATVDPDQVTNKGVVSVVLDNQYTSLLKVGEGLNIIAKVTIAGEPIYYRGMGILTVASADPND